MRVVAPLMYPCEPARDQARNYFQVEAANRGKPAESLALPRGSKYPIFKASGSQEP